VLPPALSYAVREIRENADDRHWWRQRVAANVAGPILSRMYRRPEVDVMDREWDNLFILDACRADMFEETVEIESFDTYESVHSRGCSSPEWVRENFAGREYPDTVYVTANPFVSKIAPETFHAIENVWLSTHETTAEQLAGAEGLTQLGVEGVTTIFAEDLNAAAKAAHAAYPNKRLIVHYLQPHAPCVGNPDGSRKDADEIDPEVSPGEAMKTGRVSRSRVWAAYVDNLQYVCHHADELAEELGGRTVYTADHGELFGEWLWPVPMRGYAHPSGLRHPRLTEVPWAVRTLGERRRIVPGTVGSHEADEAYLDDRLRDLGYRV
jgi:hypothetical protein